MMFHLYTGTLCQLLTHSRRRLELLDATNGAQPLTDSIMHLTCECMYMIEEHTAWHSDQVVTCISHFYKN